MSALAAAQREGAGATEFKRNLVPIFVFLSILLPQEARFELGDFTLYSYRLVLLVSLPFIVKRLLSDPIRFTLADLAMTFSSAWITIATLQVYGLERAMVSGGVLSMDMLLAYFVGRIYIRSGLDLRRFLYVVAPFVALIGFFILVESVTHTYIVRRVFGAVFGHSPDVILNKITELRLGLLRATGPFQHPISGGMLLGSLLPLYFYADLPRRKVIGMVTGLLGIFTLSSAAVLSIGGSIALIIYDRVRRVFRLGWLPLIYAMVIGLLLLEFFTESGAINFIIRYLAFNPVTGYFRQMIWDYGWADVGRHPWFGIGISEEYYRPRWMITDSVDNLWLFYALRYGVPCLVAVSFCIVANLVKMSQVQETAELGSVTGRSMRTGLAIAVSVYIVLLFTVAPWQAELAWFTMLAGMTGGLANPRMADRLVSAAVAAGKTNESMPASAYALR